MNEISDRRMLSDFFTRDILEVAPELPGMKIVRLINGHKQSWIITEVEAYRGADDLACHASKGRTKRTEIMYHNGGMIYMYLIYGVHWMLNIVTGSVNEPQAALIRSVHGITGPGRVSKSLLLDGSYYGENLTTSKRIWVEEGIASVKVLTTKRIGVEYSGELWANKPWRFICEPGNFLPS